MAASRLAVGDGDRQPLGVAETATGREFHRRPARHQVHPGTAGPPPRQPFRVRQRHHQRRVVVPTSGHQLGQPFRLARPPPRPVGVPGPQVPQRGRQLRAVGQRVVVQQRHHLGCRARAHLDRPVQQRARQPGVQPEVGHPPAAVGRAAVGVQRPQRAQHRPPDLQRTGGRRVPPVQRAAVGCAPAGQLQRQPGQVRGLDLRLRVARQRAVLVLRPAPVHPAGRLASGATGPLVGHRHRHPHGRQPRQPAPVVHPRHAREPRVHHRAHTGHGEARLRDRRRQHDPPPRARPQRRVLRARGQPPVQRQHVHVRHRQQRRRASDLRRTGQEHEHVTVPFGQCPPGRAGHAALDPLLARRCDVLRRRRERPGLGAQHRRVAEQPGQPVRGDGRGRGQQPQVRPQPGARVQQQREQQVRVQVPLVALVEQHRPHARQLRVGLEPAHQQPRRHDLDPGGLRHLPVTAHRVPDGPPDRFPQQRRHPRGGRAGRDPPRLGHDHPARVRLGQRQRHQRRLAGTRWRHQHRAAPLGERADHVVEHGTDWEVRQFHGEPVCQPGRRGDAACSTAWRGVTWKGRDVSR